MKRSKIIVSCGIAFLLALTIASIFVAHVGTTSARSKRQSAVSTGLTGTSTTRKVTGPAVNLSLPSHRPSNATPTPTLPPTPTPAPTTTSAQPVMEPPQPAEQPQSTPVAPSSTGNTSGGMTAQEASLAQQLLTQINQDRASNGGLAAYSVSDPLVISAYKHDQVMGSGCGLSHQCSGGPDPCTRMTNEGANWNTCGENIGYASGYSDYWQAVMVIHQGMMNEQAPNDGHRRNLLSQSFHKIGVSIYISGDTVWLTEDFTN